MSTDQTAREAAAFLQGYMAAKGTRTPRHVKVLVPLMAKLHAGLGNHEDARTLIDAAKRIWQKKVGRKK